MSKSCKVKSILDDTLIDSIQLKEVFIDGVLSPKYISKVVQELNNLFPIPELVHLKRVRAGAVILFPSGNIKADEVRAVLNSKGFPNGLLEHCVRRMKVPASAPLVRRQFIECNSIWPCNFHADKYLEKLSTNTLFNDGELEKIGTFMEIANRIGRYGVVVVDPKINSIVAAGYDHEEPCRHAVMVAIDNVSISQNGGAWDTRQDTIKHNLNTSGIPGDILVLLKDKYSNISLGARVYTPKSEDPDGPYLCTGLEVYASREPCIMCAMALIHSRAKRVFYQTPHAKGALGSLCKIHTIKDLNHHYEVFVVES